MSDGMVEYRGLDLIRQSSGPPAPLTVQMLVDTYRELRDAQPRWMPTFEWAMQWRYYAVMRRLTLTWEAQRKGLPYRRRGSRLISRRPYHPKGQLAPKSVLG